LPDLAGESIRFLIGHVRPLGDPLLLNAASPWSLMARDPDRIKVARQPRSTHA